MTFRDYPPQPEAQPQPEPAAGAEPAPEAPRWPLWYAPVGFFAGLLATFVAFALVAVVLGAAGLDVDEESPAVTVVGTLVQAVVLAATAVYLASRVARPRAWHFGLRPAPLWPTVGWTVLGILAFYAFVAAYSLAFTPEGEQTVTEDLGADEGTLALIVAGFVVIVVAPVAEEFFFRGFFYRALRSRLGIAAAAIVDGLVFGVIHFTGAETLDILPILAALGVIFCLLYERTGTLYAPIALHAFNNMIAYAASLEDEPASVIVSLAFGLSMIVACVVAPRLTRGRVPPAR